jgi:autoinducer 2-degrading protein
MFGVFAAISIKPDQRQRFLASISDVAVRSVLDEPGCLRFDVFQDLADADRYHLHEVYTDEAAFWEHLATPHARRAFEEAGLWADGPFDVLRTRSISPGGDRHPAAAVANGRAHALPRRERRGRPARVGR